MRSLGINSDSGGTRGEQTRLRNQMNRLFNAHVRLIYKDEYGEASVSSSVADSIAFWWNPKRPDERTLWQSKIELGEKFFNEIIRHPVPIDMNTLKALKRSPLGLDLYLWAVYRTFSLKRPMQLSWPTLYRQFGVDPSRASDKRTVDNFRTDCLRELKKIKLAWPGLNYSLGKGRPDALTLNAFDYSGGRVATAGPIALQEAPGVPQRGGASSEGRDGRVLWGKSRQPTSWTQTGRSLRPSTAAPCFRYAGSSSTSLSRWTTPIRRARNASGTAVRGGR